jgi:hypothetical protein
MSDSATVECTAAKKAAAKEATKLLSAKKRATKKAMEGFLRHEAKLLIDKGEVPSAPPDDATISQIERATLLLKCYNELLAKKPKETTFPMPPETWPGNIYYDDSSGGQYWVPRYERTEWTKVPERVASRYLELTHGVPTDGPMKRTLEDIRNNHAVAFAGKLAGYAAGLIEQNSLTMLVTKGARLIEPNEGEFQTIERFLYGLLGAQRIYVEGWLKVAVEALRAGSVRNGQALALCGQAGCGKSFLQTYIFTPLIGGRSINPFLAMSGATSFNSTLLENEHWLIQDEGAAPDQTSRRDMAASIKQATANDELPHHAKGKDLLTMTPFRRLSISCNEDPKYLRILPSMDGSLLDKVLVLKAYKAEMPMPTETNEEREAFRARISAELPAYLYYLLFKFQIPADLRDVRYGVKSYQNPEIMRLIEELDPEYRLLELIDVNYRGRVVPWEGRASRLEAELTCHDSFVQHQARMLLKFNNSCGTLLNRLAEKFPNRVESRLVNRYGYYKITGFPPMDPDERKGSSFTASSLYG